MIHLCRNKGSENLDIKIINGVGEIKIIDNDFLTEKHTFE